MKKKRSVITWREVRRNGYHESGVIYNNNRMPCDEIYFKWIIDEKVRWSYELTVAEAMQMIRGLSSALYYKLSKDEVKKFGKSLNKNNLL